MACWIRRTRSGTGTCFQAAAARTAADEVTIVAEMLGVPKERHEDFRCWSHVINSNLSFGHETPEARAALHSAASRTCCADRYVESHSRNLARAAWY